MFDSPFFRPGATGAVKSSDISVATTAVASTRISSATSPTTTASSSIPSGNQATCKRKRPCHPRQEFCNSIAGRLPARWQATIHRRSRQSLHDVFRVEQQIQLHTTRKAHTSIRVGTSCPKPYYPSLVSASSSPLPTDCFDYPIANCGASSPRILNRPAGIYGNLDRQLNDGIRSREPMEKMVFGI